MDFYFRHGDFKRYFPTEEIGMNSSEDILEACHSSNPGFLTFNKVTTGRTERML